MAKPYRVQLSRRKGWRKPENTVVVSRPSKWGNPFKAGQEYDTVAAGPQLCADAAKAVQLFWPVARCRKDEIVRELRGKNLACWCRLDQPCHADVLLEIANQ